MESLPLELLGMIVDSVRDDRDPGVTVFSRQRTLAALARTNKTFYSICRRRLSTHVAFRNAEMARKWSRKYSSLVDPWSICSGTKHLENALKDVIVPESLVLDYREPEKRRDGFPENIDLYLLPELALSTFFFRNSTTFKVSGAFQLPISFLVGLFGPAGQNRSIAEHLALDSDYDRDLNAMLFEALNRIRWSVEYDFEDPWFLNFISGGGPDADFLNGFQQRLNENSFSYEDTDKAEAIILRLAASDHRFFPQLDPLLWPHSRTLPDILKTRHVPCCPFSSLRSLSFWAEAGYEVYCVLYSRLFPALRHLKLSGCLEFAFGDTLETRTAVAHDVKLLRCSITKRRGVIIPPMIDESVTILFPNAFDSWAPLERDESRAAPAIEYFGPNLTKLDLSDYGIGFF